MKEVEVKILEIDRPKIERLLVELGGEKTFDGEMHAAFFDFSDKRIRKKGDVLRVRQEGETVVMTYKAHLEKGAAKVMAEHETVVGSMDEVQAILTAMGMQVVKETHKHRTEYELPTGKVVIDDYKGSLAVIPLFLEIEAPDLAAIYGIAESLGYGPADCKNWNTADLIVHYQIS